MNAKSSNKNNTIVQDDPEYSPLEYRRPSQILPALIKIGKMIVQQGIQKTRSNTMQNYKFRGIDEAMNAFAPLFAENGVLIFPQYTNRQLQERHTKKGDPIFNVTIEGTFTFVHEDGSRETIGPLIGEAMDSADKATNKAMAVAFKYALFQTFCVPLEGITDGDPDAVSHSIASDEEVKKIAIELLNKSKTTKDLQEKLTELWMPFKKYRKEIKAEYDRIKYSLEAAGDAQADAEEDRAFGTDAVSHLNGE